MNYEIKSFDRITGSALVRFWTDDYPDGLQYNIDVPVKDGAYLSGAELDAHIRCFSPTGQIERMVAVKTLDASAIEALVTPVPPPPEKTAEQLAEEAREAAKRERVAYVSGIKVTTQSGRIFDGDETSQNRMARAIVALNAQPQDPVPTITWVLADNTSVQATAAELTEALALAGAAQAAVWVI